MMAALALAGLVSAGCGPESIDDAYVDHDPEVARQGLNAGQAGGCDTSIVAGLTGQLVAELNCIQPNTMVDFRGPGITLSNAVQPFLNPGAAAALQQAVAASGTSISLSSAYRSVAQQYLLLKWFNAGQCGIQAAAVPGKSNHQSGRAIDVPSYNFWISKLQAKGWTWYGSGDLVHFDFNAAPNLGSNSVLAFQKLWNKNNANKIDEDGQWGPQTESAMAQSPTTGFAKFGCGQMTPPAQTGTLKGRVYAVNPADPSDLTKGIAGATVTVAGKTLTSDAGGMYEAQLAAGTYLVVATAAGFGTASLSRMVTAGQTSWGSVGLSTSGMPDTLPPEVTLASPQGGAKVGVAEVTLSGTASDAQGTVASLTLSVNGGAAAPVQVMNGAFSQTVRLQPGPNALRFVAADARGNTATADFALTFETGIDGLALSVGGALAGATIEAVAAADGRTFSVQSAMDGTFRFELEPGLYLVRVLAEGHFVQGRDIVVGAETREAATFTLLPEPKLPEQKASGGCSAAPGLIFGLAALVLARRRRRA